MSAQLIRIGTSPAGVHWGHSMMFPARTSRLGSSCPGAAPALPLPELVAPPLERGLEPVLGPDLIELAADLGRGGVKRSHHVEPGLDRIAEAGVLDPAIDGALGGLERLGRDQGEAFGVFQR